MTAATRACMSSMPRNWRVPCAFRRIRAGAVLLNLVTLEDLCVHDGKVTGVVVNRTTISGALPVDPIVLQAENVIDGTGHEAVAVERLRARNLLAPQAGLGRIRRRADGRDGRRGVRRRTGSGGLSGFVGDGHGRLRHLRRSPDGADLRRHAAVGPKGRRTDPGKDMKTIMALRR